MIWYSKTVFPCQEVVSIQSEDRDAPVFVLRNCGIFSSCVRLIFRSRLQTKIVLNSDALQIHRQGLFRNFTIYLPYSSVDSYNLERRHPLILLWVAFAFLLFWGVGQIDFIPFLPSVWRFWSLVASICAVVFYMTSNPRVFWRIRSLSSYRVYLQFKISFEHREAWERFIKTFDGRLV
ncbi:MAG: hypothetical protein D6805_06230 [Planctomycetota bacterium]|nr:MAG: hypothetical protein D6805_06230 [Planctomycetota bacterium]